MCGKERCFEDTLFQGCLRSATVKGNVKMSWQTRERIRGLHGIVGAPHMPPSATVKDHFVLLVIRTPLLQSASPAETARDKKGGLKDLHSRRPHTCSTALLARTSGCIPCLPVYPSLGTPTKRRLCAVSTAWIAGYHALRLRRRSSSLLSTRGSGGDLKNTPACKRKFPEVLVPQYESQIIIQVDCL